MRVISVILLSLALVGCGGSEDRSTRIRDFLDHDNKSAKRNDQSNAVLIIKKGNLPWDEVGAVYGFVDNMDACKDMVAPYNRTAKGGITYECASMEESYRNKP